MKRLVALTFLALTLFSLCIQGARWQYDRYESRHARNELIRANLAKTEITEAALIAGKRNDVAWRKIELAGSFQPETEILVRNRYYLERYGFAVVTLFRSESGRLYWVDRGWVAPGADASTPPITRAVSEIPIIITARVRSEDIERQIGGSVFAIPNNSGESRLASWNAKNDLKTEPYYFDLISSSEEEFNPEAPTLVPELSDGPHLAYTFQWILFAGFVIFGYVMVLREDRKAQAEKA